MPKYNKASMDRYYYRLEHGLPLRAKKEASAAPKAPEASNALSKAQKAAESASHPEHPTLFDFPEENEGNNGTYSR